MKTLNAGQSTLIARRGLTLVNLVVLTTYTDRDAETVDTTYYFSDRYVLYDYGNTGTDRQFEPFLIHVELDRVRMTHLPEEDSGFEDSLRRILFLRLHNRVRQTATTANRLYVDLRADNLEFASVEWAQLALDSSAGEGTPDLTSFVGNEHTVRFRGDLKQVQSVDQSEIALRFESRLPQIPWLVASDSTKNDPRDVGRRVPIVYGAMNKVPAVGWDVGAVTTLRTELAVGDSTVELTDASAFPTSGNCRIGAEEVSWTSKSGNDLTGTVTRGASSTKETGHSAGESVIEIPTTITFLLAAHECDALQALYVRSLVSGELITVPSSLYTITLNDTTTVSGETVCSVSFTAANLRTLLTNMVQAVEHPSAGGFEQIGMDADTVGTGEERPWVVGGNSNYIGDYRLDFRTNVTFASYAGPHSGKQLLRFYWSGGLTLRIRETVGLATVLSIPATSQAGDYSFLVTSSVDQFEIGATTNAAGCNLGNFRREIVGGNSFITRREQAQQVERLSTPTDTDLETLRDSLDATGESVTGAQINMILVATFPTPPASEVIKGQRLHFRIRNNTAGTDKPILHVREGSGGADPIIFDMNPGSLNAEFDTDTIEELTIESDDGTVNAFRFELEQGFLADVERTLIIETTVPAVAIAQGGAGLQFYADLDGVPAPDANYTVASGVLLEDAQDILRHIIADLCGLGHTVIDSTSWSSSDTNLLAGQKHALILNSLGSEFGEIVMRLAFEARSNLVLDERLTTSTYRLLNALTTYAWPASARTIDEWSEVREVGREGDTLRTRFRALYAWDPSIGDSEEAFVEVVRIDPDQDDVTNPSVTDLNNAEDRYGRRDAPAFVFLTIQDLTTAEDRAGYYADEHIRVAATREVEGVPWTLGYDLERGDVVTLTPPWDTVAAKHRVVEVEKDVATEMVRLVLVEVL